MQRSTAFAFALAVAYLLPFVIPRVGVEEQYYFIMVIVLLAWFIVKWSSVRSITQKSGNLDILLGATVIGADYAYNFIRGATVGILDLMIILLASVVLSFGLKALKFFWVPAAYSVILLAGYQLEAYIPNYVALQDWLAGVMTSAVNALGISASVQGTVVTMIQPNGELVQLEVSGACTGLQGILAFGVLSSMALLDLKSRVSRIIPIFAIGFIGAFLINILRLLVVFLTFEYMGVGAGTAMHVYFGYTVFIVWVLAFWAFAFRYLVPTQLSQAKTLVAINP